MISPRIINDWTPVVSSLLFRFIKAGYRIHSIDDGGECHSGKDGITVSAAIDIVCGVDEASVRLRKDAHKVTLYIVLGNEPFETVCDYGASDAVMQEVEDIVDDFSAFWEGKSCPTKQV